MLLMVALAVSTMGALLARYAQPVAATFAVACSSLVVTAASICVVSVTMRRARELDAALRFLVPSPPAFGRLLGDLGPETRLCATLAGAAGAVCGLGVAGSYVSDGRNAAVWALVAVAVLTAFILGAGLDCVRQRGRTWRGPLQDLAEGAASLRLGQADEASVNGVSTLRLDNEGDTLMVLVDDSLPAPEYAARYVFGAGAYREEPGEALGWQRYRRVDPSPSQIDRTPSDTPLPRPIAARLGPIVSASLVVSTALAVTLSVLHGAPDRLPGWALESPFVFETARAGLIVLGLVLAANLLIALASGRLVSKVSAQGGLELDAATLVAETAGSDRATADGLLALNRRLDIAQEELTVTVQRTVRIVASVNARLDAVTQALAESASSESVQPASRGDS